MGLFRRKRIDGPDDAEFETYLKDRIRDALENLSPEDAADAYVVSLFVYDEEDDPKFPTVTVSINTEAQVRLSTNPPEDFAKPNEWWTPTDESEARWNFAFWTQTPLAIIADSSSDPRGAQLRRDWFGDMGLPVDLDWRDVGDDEADALASRFTKMFVDLMVSTVKSLHQAGVVETIFGRPIPLVIHELEYYDAIAEQNVRANGRDLAGGLVAWISSF
jgi:hypothetical protein